MNTTADKLELLLRTKERQRAYLQQKYPLLDFDNIPFRAYLDLFQGRSYVPGFVGGWKAYGRSNDEDAETRDILPDYSGNGRDIKLYNFAFEGNSGYNGFVDNTHIDEEWSYIHEYVDIAYSKDKTKAKVSQIKKRSVIWVFLKGIASDPVGTKYKLKARIQGVEDYINLGKKVSVNLGDSTSNFGLSGIVKDGVYETEFVKTESTYNYIGLNLHVDNEDSIGACSMTFEQIPDYPGALVSDGVDDYGIVDNLPVFTKENGYTVLAIRKWLDDNPTKQTFVSKLNSTDTLGAFSFEAAESSASNTYSFGGPNTVTYPVLFSYQTLNKYNLEELTRVGSTTDGSLLYLFRGRDSYQNYAKIALYDLRIYDHSLTEEELQTVKDEMMQDYENATGGGYS